MRRTIVAAIAAVALLLAPVPAQAAFPGENGRIATTRYEYVGHEPGFPDVYTVNPDGSGSTALTRDDTSSQPAWSADGERIAFMKVPFPQPGNCESQCADIYVMNADGTGLTKVTSGNSYDFSPAWSPDGSKIVFASYRNGNSDIYTMNADGNGVTRITTDPEWDTAPAWSPRGDEIAYSRYSPGNGYMLHVVRADGSGERQLVVGEHPDWSPDGSRLAYQDQSQIWVVNADGTGAVKLTTEPTTTYPDEPYFLLFNHNPAWSPDGSMIVFDHGECSWGACFPPLLETVNPDGSGRARIATWPDSSGGEPDWQPIPGPQRSDYRNASHYCKALREFLGDAEFRNRYGGGANAHGKCVSTNH
jgi:TolB protein